MAVEPLLDTAFLRLLDRLSIIIRRAMAGDMQGERRSPHHGSSVEFADFRPYTPGDDFRRIDWNLYARIERIFVKLFVAEEELTFRFLVDSSRSMDWGEPNKLQTARQLAGAFGYLALNGLDRVGAVAFGGGEEKPSYHTMTPVRGKRGVWPFFSFLQNISAAGGEGNGLFAACTRIAHTTRTPGPLFLCSDLFDPQWKESLQMLTATSRSAFDVVLIHILAPQEISPQIEGDARLIDSEGGRTVEITAGTNAISLYRERLAAWRQEVESFCHRRGITYLFVNTATPIEDIVLSYVRHGGQREGYREYTE